MHPESTHCQDAHSPGLVPQAARTGGGHLMPVAAAWFRGSQRRSPGSHAFRMSPEPMGSSHAVSIGTLVLQAVD